MTGDRTRPKMRAVASKHQKERRKRKVMEREVVAAAWWGGGDGSVEVVEKEEINVSCW